MSEDYTYDVFISYRHRGHTAEWVKNHFYPMLEQRLPECMPVDHDTKIFVDLKIETGSTWPAGLRQALKMSRCILAVWSPDYFRSEWCLAEWHTFRERERLANMISNSNSRGLIYPVVFADGEHFPQTAKDVQQRDLKKWNYPYPVFRETAGFLDFDKEVQALADELSGMVRRAPQWQDWPVVTPSADQRVVIKLPRL